MGINNIISFPEKIENVEKIENRGKLFWIDRNINNNENKKYQVILRDMNFDLLALENENEGINEIKKIKFEKINILISGSLFQNFINLIKSEKTKISCVINIVVFTSIIRKSHIEEICNKENDILNGLLFTKKNIFCSISQIQEFLLSLGKKEREKEEIFEKIQRTEQILPHIYYPQLLKPITKEEIHIFNQYLINSCNKKDMKELIGQLEEIPEMPNEIICKYWARAYTLETNFYSDMRHELQTKKGKHFCPYIKMMYEGIKNKVLTPKYDQVLYRGSKISLSELNNLEEYLNEPNESIFPKLILYFRGFQSFSLLKNVALNFMNKSSPPNDHIKVLFLIKPFNAGQNSFNLINQEIENENIHEFLSNAYIKEFSRFPSEEEVLFFPLSSFEVTKINREFNDHVEITLEYLGKYRKNININPQNILPFFQASEFGKDILELELINYKRRYSWNVDKEIYIEEGDVSSVLYLENNIILFSVDNIIKLYNIENNRNILNINIHLNDINDLLKVGNHKFISSSKDNTIKYFELNDNYLNYKIIETINIHTDEVNQTIKLKMDNYYASCSNDNNICIWFFDHNNKFKLYKELKGHRSQVTSIFELSDNSIISISRAGFLKFWENYKCVKSLQIDGIPLNHCIFPYSENLIVMGTNKSFIFLNIVKKEIIKIIPLNFTSNSFCNFYGDIILGLKENNYCFLREYKNFNYSFELIAEGKDDRSLEISYIQIIDERTIITANKNQYIKIWKKGNAEMPKLIQSPSSQNIILTLENKKSDFIPIHQNFESKGKGKIYNSDEEREEEIENRIKELEEKELIEKTKGLKGKGKEKEKEKEIKSQKNFDEIKGKKEQKNNKPIKEENNITINIVDCEQKINFSIVCNKNDKFLKIEELFYERYPEYKKTINLFTCNGSEINKNKSLQENFILNNDTIVLLSSDF